MTEKLKILEVAGRVWTAAVAYVALIIGAGLSITFNVVDVMDVRGANLDRWDIVTAVAFPALVVLMVELFVSRLWTGQRWPMQIIRWAGTLAIGGIAMRVSWVHGHDFFLSRGQAKDVANLAPLAIDLLAIMATALILSGRGRVQLSRPAVQAIEWPMGEPVLATPLDTELASAAEDVDRATVQLGQEMASEAESWLAGLSSRVQSTESTPAAPVVQPVAKDKASRVSSRVDINDQEAAELARVGKANGLLAKDIAELLAGHYGTSDRTIRRRAWWVETMANTEGR